MKKAGNYYNQAGFTLIELLVVISVIGFLATASLVMLDNARRKTRDAKRLADMAQIKKALELYYDTNNQFPANTDDDCSGWDTGYFGSGDSFISPLATSGTLKNVPGDPLYNTQCGGYRYYRYGAGTAGCDATKGAFFVLGITNMETVSGTHPSSPGWQCSGNNWQGGFKWVTGGFER